VVGPDEICRGGREGGGGNAVETGQGDGSDCTALLHHTEHMSVSCVYGREGVPGHGGVRPQVARHSQT